MADDKLDGVEIVMLIEALDAFIGFQEGTGNPMQANREAEERWAPYRALRERLKDQVHMSFYDSARGWLESELSRERQAVMEKLFTWLAAALRDPKTNRRLVREGFASRMRELREERQSPPRPFVLGRLDEQAWHSESGFCACCALGSGYSRRSTRTHAGVSDEK